MLRVKHLALGNKSTRCMDEFIQCVHELFKMKPATQFVMASQESLKLEELPSVLLRQKKW